MTALDTISSTLARARATEPTLRAFLQTFPRGATRAAARLDAVLARDGGVRGASAGAGALAGMPVAVKNNLCLAPGFDGGTPTGAARHDDETPRTTAGSRILEHYVSPFTATCVQRLVDAGAIVVGTTNLDEFSMGSSTERSAFGPTRNPHDPARVPGGSSGGSAAAVAAGVVPAALGSDTGGSIRQPAAFCGVVGFKPTYGRVSRYGLIAYASSLDQVGPIARDVHTCARVYDAIAGHDPRDMTSSDRPVESAAEALTRVFAAGGPKIGVPAQARSPVNHPGVQRALEDSIAALRAEGATVIDVDLPLLEDAVAMYYIVATAEASSNLARYDGVRYGRRAKATGGATGGAGGGTPENEAHSLAEMYARSRAEGLGAEVKRRILLGTHVLSSGYYDAYYTTALRARRALKHEFDRALIEQGCDALLMPVTPGPAFRIGEKLHDPVAMYLEDVYTVGVNLAGLPAISVPAGVVRQTADTPAGDDSGREVTLPVGVQLIGAAFEDAKLLRVAALLERALGPGARVTPAL